jgi:hypothetical protein
MAKIDWVTLIGGGLLAIPLTLWFERLFKRGKLKLDSSSLIIQIIGNGGSNLINRMFLDLQFVNTSGLDKQITALEVYYQDGADKTLLEIKDYNVPPAELITPKQTKCLKFELLYDFGRFNDPIASISLESLYIQVNYKVDGKETGLTIPYNEIRVQPSTFQVTAF